MSMEEVMNGIKGGKVVEANRLQSKRGEVLNDTLSVVLHFEKILPRLVQIGYMNFSVKEYISKPLRFYVCQRMGHIAQQCKGKLRCARCGVQYEYGKYGKDGKVKCCNCVCVGGGAQCCIWRLYSAGRGQRSSENQNKGQSLTCGSNKVRMEGACDLNDYRRTQRNNLQSKNESQENQAHSHSIPDDCGKGLFLHLYVIQ